MNYVFFGTPEFAAIILERLIKADFVPRLVVCNPDRPVGRRKVTAPPPVKQRIMNCELGIREKIKILQPEKLEKEFLNSLFQIHNSTPLDFAVLAAYGKILPKEIISLPKSGTLVVHPSLLPRFRGATPVQSAILAGDKVTGASIILADEKADHGPIVAGKELEIKENDTYKSLLGRLADLSAELLIKTIPEWLGGKIEPRTQNENYATYTKKFTAEDAYVEPQNLQKAEREGGEIAVQIERKIRALNPEPGMWTIITPEIASLIRANKKMVGKRMKILETELKDGKLVLKKIQIESKKPQIL